MSSTNLQTIKNALGDDYLDLSIKKLTIEEDLAEEVSKVHVVTEGAGGHQVVVEGKGVGFVDALVHGLLERYAQEYQSLKTIELSKFSVDADIDTTKSQHTGADAVAVVKVEVRNSEQRVFEFSDASRSVIASAARAVLSGIEYFVNAERAFIVLHKAQKDAQDRGRADLAARYTRELSEVVKSTSYTEVIEQIKSELEE